MKSEVIVSYDPSLKSNPERMLEVFADALAKELCTLFQEAAQEDAVVQELRVSASSPQSITLKVQSVDKELPKVQSDEEKEQVEHSRKRDADEHADREHSKLRTAEIQTIKAEDWQKHKQEVAKPDEHRGEVPKKDFRDGDHSTDLLKNISK